MKKSINSLSEISPAFYDSNAKKVIDLIRIAQENANTLGEAIALYQTNHKKNLRLTPYLAGKWKGQALLEIIHPSSSSLKKLVF